MRVKLFLVRTHVLIVILLRGGNCVFGLLLDRRNFVLVPLMQVRNCVLCTLTSILLHTGLGTFASIFQRFLRVTTFALRGQNGGAFLVELLFLRGLVRFALGGCLLDFRLVGPVILSGFSAALLGFGALIQLLGSSALFSNTLNTTSDHVYSPDKIHPNKWARIRTEKLDWCTLCDTRDLLSDGICTKYFMQNAHGSNLSGSRTIKTSFQH